MIDDILFVSEFIDVMGVTLAIPRAVILELDGLKSSGNKTVASKAKVAINIVHSFIHREIPGVMIQSGQGGVCKNIDGYKSMDNAIVNWTRELKISARGCNVVLLTNDLNLQTLSKSFGVSSKGTRFMKRNMKDLIMGDINSANVHKLFCTLDCTL